MKTAPFFLLILSVSAYSQTITITDKNTKQINSYREVTTYYDGTKMTDQKLDNKIYIKLNGKFYRKNISTENTPMNYGAKGNATYRSNGDINQLEKGDDDSQSIDQFIKSRKKTADMGSHLGGSSLYFPYSIYKVKNAYLIDDHYTEITGEGAGASVIHALSDGKNSDIPIFTFKKGIETSNTWDALLSGGGFKNIQFKTDNSAIRNTAVLLDYVEFMKFEDVNFSGFGNSAIKGNFWEGYFKNLKFEGCGTMQKADKSGNPLNGIIDTDSDSKSKFRDASNNSLFEKLTFSSCTGTLLKFTTVKNTAVNLNVNGLYAESYPGDLGKADELPFVYMIRAKNCSINNGFITVNTSRVKRNATIFKLDEGSDLSVSNLNITLNPEKTFLDRSVQRLRTFGIINASSKLSLSSVTIGDPTDSVGFEENSTPPFFEGNGTLNFNLVTIQTLSYNNGGTRRITNIFDRSLEATGNVLFQLFDQNGSVKQLQKKITFENGKIYLSANEIPLTPETWMTGDRILYDAPKGCSLGQICVTAGTSGQLNNVKGSADKGSKTISLNNSKGLLNGDWISYGSNKEYNRISNISGNTLTLQQPVGQKLSNSSIGFHAPAWKEFGCSN